MYYDHHLSLKFLFKRVQDFCSQEFKFIYETTIVDIRQKRKIT